MHREAIIHIGTPKTGSTSIQAMLQRHRNDLLAQGVFFPRSPGAAAHAMLTNAASGTRAIQPRSAIWNGQAPKIRLTEFRAEFAAEMQTLPANVRRVIFTDERLSVLLRDTKTIEALRTILAPHFSTFTILVYLRRQDSFLASQYAQMLRSGMVRDPESLIDSHGTVRHFDYLRLLSDWAAVFGDAAIKPRIYERSASNAFDSVADFVDACGLDITLRPDDRRRNLNPSMNASGQRLLREIGRMLQAQSDTRMVANPIWQPLAEAVTRVLPGKGWMPTRSQAEHFMRQFEASNEAVRARFCPDRATLFAGDYQELPVSSEELSDRECFEAACRTLIEGVALATRRNRAAAPVKVGRRRVGAMGAAK